VKDVRILTPKEYEALKAAIPKDQHKTILSIYSLLQEYDTQSF